MQRKFESLLDTLYEMAATFKNAGDVKQTISDIKSKNLPHHYQKPQGLYVQGWQDSQANLSHKSRHILARIITDPYLP
jgi:hypothetical protein